MRLSNIFKTILVAISYQSVKKVIDGYPEPYKTIVIFLLRLTLYFIIFLLLFSFFSNQIFLIGKSVNSPSIFVNILVGIFFVLCLFVSYIFTAVIGQIYRKLSEIKQGAEKKMENVKNTAQAPVKIIKNSVKSTWRTLAKTGQSITQSSKKVYEASSKITSIAFDVGRKKLDKLNLKIKRGKKNKN